MRQIYVVNNRLTNYCQTLIAESPEEAFEKSHVGCGKEDVTVWFYPGPENDMQTWGKPPKDRGIPYYVANVFWGGYANCTIEVSKKESLDTWWLAPMIQQPSDVRVIACTRCGLKITRCKCKHG